MTAPRVREQEALRYLGLRGHPADNRTLDLLHSCSSELETGISPHCVSQRFPLQIHGNLVQMGPLEAVSSKLAYHLRNCSEVFLFAATLGPFPDVLIRRYSALDMSRAVVLQACAASLIESYCDLCGHALAEQVRSEGLYLCPRFSPGYSDFDIRFQKLFLDILNAQKRIGLTATDSMMLAPSKSVTAVIGLTSHPQSCHKMTCEDCPSTDCPFRKDAD